MGEKRENGVMDVQFFISWMTEWWSNVLFYAHTKKKSVQFFRYQRFLDGVSQS